MEPGDDLPDSQADRSLTALLAELAKVVGSLPPDRQEMLQEALAMSDAPNLVEALRTAIRESGRTHYDLGKAAGVTPAQIDRFMAGERDLRLETAGRIAAALNLELRPVARKGKRAP